MSFAYPARLLSDLHLGHDVSTIQSVQQLEPLLEGIATLILNGDTVESKLASFRDRSHAMLAELRTMADERGVALVLVNGNHDPSLWPHDWLDLAGGKVFVTHGHVLLDMVSPWSANFAPATCHGCDSGGVYPGGFGIHGATIRTHQTVERNHDRDPGAAVRHGLGRQAGNGVARTLATISPVERHQSLDQSGEDCRSLCRSIPPCLPSHAVCTPTGPRGGDAMGRLLVNTGGFVSFASPLAVEFPNETGVQIRRVELRDGKFQLGKVKVQEMLATPAAASKQ